MTLQCWLDELARPFAVDSVDACARCQNAEFILARIRLLRLAWINRIYEIWHTGASAPARVVRTAQAAWIDQGRGRRRRRTSPPEPSVALYPNFRSSNDTKRALRRAQSRFPRACSTRKTEKTSSIGGTTSPPEVCSQAANFVRPVMQKVRAKVGERTGANRSRHSEATTMPSRIGAEGDDPLLPSNPRKRLQNRSRSGVVRQSEGQRMEVAKRT